LERKAFANTAFLKGEITRKIKKGNFHMPFQTPPRLSGAVTQTWPPAAAAAAAESAAAEGGGVGAGTGPGLGPRRRFFVAVHVGAGFHAPSNEKVYRRAMKRACLAAAAVLREVQ
jgi:hypothetical protein